MEKALLKQILIIEDNPGDAYYAQRLLSEDQLADEYVIINDGEDAQAHLEACANGKKEMPDLIFLDLHLPKVNGLDLLKFIRTNPHLNDLKVIILTISKETKDFINSMVNGVEHYTVKPLTKTEVNSILESMNFFCKKTS